jgi:fructose-specific phosphotransferase system IIC component
MTTPAGSPREKSTGRETYDTVADTVGLVPSLHWKDNLIQGLTVAVVTLVAAGIGLSMNGTTGLAVGALAGLVASLFLSGFVLMIVGWIRTARKAKGG